MTTFITFDPAVINDDGTIRLYYGWSLAVAKEHLPRSGADKAKLKPVMISLFEKTSEEIDDTPEGLMGANTVELEDDMLTIKHQPKRVVPGQFDAEGTSFEGHAFFEGSSIRKIGGRYYFICPRPRIHS